MHLALGDRRYDVATRALVMGILNRTTDSFFDKGAFYEMDRFLTRAGQLMNNLTFQPFQVFLSVAAVAWIVSFVTRRAFERSNEEQTAALVSQFQREFQRHADDVVHRVESTKGGLQ